MKEVLGDAYVDPREHVHYPWKNSGGKFVSQKKPSQQTVPKNPYTLGYLVYAYGVSKTTFFRRRDAEKCGAALNTPLVSVQRFEKGHTAIDNRANSRTYYTPRFFFSREKAMGNAAVTGEDGKALPGWGTYQTRFAHWGKVYDTELLKGTDMSRYERMEREHDARQPFVQRDLVQALEGNVCRSYRQLSKYINGWCAPSTIEVWLKTHETFKVYAKNIKPGLSMENRAKQVLFSKHVHNMWGLDPATTKKILWVMCDEKWFHGLVPRANAKACAELGIEKESYSAHHKKHIAKVMVHCTVAYCFEGMSLIP
jgi:hypothetical protein